MTNIRPEGPRLPADFVAKDHAGLRAFAELLIRWNAKINLVGRQDIQNLWPRHIEDSLFLYQCLPSIDQAPWVLDAGTGGGLPGMVLAILDAHVDVVAGTEATTVNPRNYLLIDRSERKIRFLNQVVGQLKLPNVLTLCGDFTAPLAPSMGANRDLVMPEEFGAICARAVAPPETLWANLKHLLNPNGELLVACGPQTREQLPLGVDVEWLPDRGAAGDRGVVRLTEKHACT